MTINLFKLFISYLVKYTNLYFGTKSVIFSKLSNLPLSSLAFLESRGGRKAWVLTFCWECNPETVKGGKRETGQDWKQLKVNVTKLPTAFWRVKVMPLIQTGRLQAGCTENMCWNSLLEGGRQMDLSVCALPSHFSHRSMFAPPGISLPAHPSILHHLASLLLQIPPPWNANFFGVCWIPEVILGIRAYRDLSELCWGGQSFCGSWHEGKAWGRPCHQNLALASGENRTSRDVCRWSRVATAVRLGELRSWVVQEAGEVLRICNGSATVSINLHVYPFMIFKSL